MFRKILVTFISVVFIITSIGIVPTQPVVASQPDPEVSEVSFATDRLIVKFRPEVKIGEKSLSTHVVSLDNTLSSINALGLESLRGLGSTYVLKVGKGTDIATAVVALNQDPAVEYAEPDYLAQFASVPNDPRYTEQWGLPKIAVEGAWDQSMGSPNVIIAVIDSGIDLTHEDLAPNLWTNLYEIPDNGLDDDNNTFVDDVQGWNFVDSTNEVDDFVGHGSLVAGVAAAKANNAVGIAGVCGNCKLMPIKVSQVSGFANYSDIAAGVAYATQKGADVINISLGGYANSITLQNAINEAVADNIVVVAGAGNDNKSDAFYPAAYENVIAVAGTDQSDQKTASSNFGAWVDVSAPGVDILSTTLGGYSSDSGTSYAAPFVSGAVGLLLSLHPDWTPALIRSQFLHTSDTIDSLNPGFEGKLGAGRLDVSQALQTPQPILTYQSYSGNGTPNLRPDFGSTVALTVSLYNDWADAAGVTGILSSTDGYVSISEPSASFGDVLSGETRSNAAPFSFDIASGAGYSHSMPFSLALSANGGAYTTTLSFTITTRSSEETVWGTIDTDTLWTSDKTYKVTGSVGVDQGYTLTIQPGTVVKFTGEYSLNIYGTLITQGTPEQPIRFEPYTAGGTWGRISFNDTSTDAMTTVEGVYQSGNVLQYVEISGATTGIGCTSATPFLDHVNTNSGGVSCSLGDTDLWLSNSTFVGEVNFSQGGITPEHISGLQVSGGNVTLPASAVTDANLTGTLAIQGDGQVTNSTLGGLSINGVGDVQQVDSNGSISISSGQVMGSNVTGSISVGSAGTVSNCELKTGGISAGEGSTITRNNIENATGDGINISSNSTVTFNRVVGAGQGIVASAGVVENNLVANTTGDGLHPGEASVRNNTFTGIGGNAVYLDQVPVAFEYNNFEFNKGTYDVYVAVPKATIINLLAQNNWWGTTDAEAIKIRTWDYYYDPTLAKLITGPLLTSPSQEAPAYVRGVTLDPESPVGIQTVNFTVEFSRPMDANIASQLAFVSVSSDTWTTKAPMPTERSCLGVAAASNGKIYAIGGGGGVNIVEEYDPLTNTWTTKAPMPTGRGYLGVAAASNGKIYAIGGEGGENVVEEYNPLTDTWTTKAPMPTSRYGLGVAAASNGKIYAIGGWWTNAVEEFDPLTNSWTTKAPLPNWSEGLSVSAASNGKIYAFGSGPGYYLSEEYNPLTNTWKNKAPMPNPRWMPGVTASSNGKIYVIGGDSGMTLVEEYDPLTDTWMTKAPTPTPRGSLGVAAASNGKIYAIGGAGGGNVVEEYTPPDWGLTDVIDNPIWLDETHFQSSYDFTSIVPRGEYFITVIGGLGTDGILSAPFKGAQFVVDYAGEISDTTPPSTPFVSAWGNGSLSQLSASALANDPDSQIVGYRYAIGTTSGGADVLNWTNTSTTEITRIGLLLQPDQAYYVSFQARNQGGLWSPVGVSNPVTNGLPLVNHAPVSNAGPDQSVATAALVTLDGTGSSDPDGDTPLTYQWTQTAGTTVTLSSTTASKPSFTAPSDPATLTFSLVVTDSRGMASQADEVVIVVSGRKIFLPMIQR